MTQRVVDLFAGPGGWDQGLRDAGFDGTVVGLEWDESACRTAEAAGHTRICVDISATDPSAFDGWDGLIASPPCQEFSSANAFKRGLDSERGSMLWEIVRWADAIRPRWVACEQVPGALDPYRQIEAHLRTMGYSTWSGILNAADYGVPQRRRRAFLLANIDGPALPPDPTHAEEPTPTLYGQLEPWVTIRQATGEGRTLRPGVVDGRNKRRYSPDEPAPTLAFGHDAASWGWEDGDGFEQMSTVEAGALQSFPADYPWRGAKSQKFTQVGNAVPPKLAQVVLEQFVGAAVPA